MKVAYWPGCVSRGFTPELHGSMAAVAPLLDIELVELDRAACCGAGVIAEHNQELADTLNARTFALAQKVQGAELMMNICSTCQGAQSECQERLDANTEYRERINGNLTDEALSYEKGLNNKNFLWLLVEEIGLDALKAKVKRPLTDLRVGPFYGCYIVRPVNRLGIDEEHPRDDLGVGQIITLGAYLADVPHSRATPVTGTSADEAYQALFDVEPPTYEGPVGITGVFQEACRFAGIPLMSFWAAVPHYVAHPPVPKATLALLRRLEDVLDLSVPTKRLAEEAQAWEAGVDELAENDTEVGEYVRTLEEQRDNEDAADLPEASGEAIAREFERYLRRQERRRGSEEG